MKLFLSAFLCLLGSPAAIGREIFSLHGSGTSNPSKCYWDIFDRMMREASQPLQLTYRSIGSSGGQADFQAGFSDSSLVNAFNSGDIPVSTEIYEAINNNETAQFVHFPVLAGAVSFFHSVPGIDNLKLTPCIIAGIYNGDIDSWGHADIVALNDLSSEAKDLPIYYGTRLEGSSSTSSVTKYLNEACTNGKELDSSLVSKLPSWPGNARKLICSKSDGMTDCIQNQKGVIGYIDSGHGHTAGLKEVSLQNKAGDFLTTKEAKFDETITTDPFPPQPDGDFGAVSFLDTSGAEAWPIVQMT